jgi:hypothetical protein
LSSWSSVSLNTTSGSRMKRCAICRASMWSMPAGAHSARYGALCPQKVPCVMPSAGHSPIRIYRYMVTMWPLLKQNVLNCRTVKTRDL